MWGPSALMVYPFYMVLGFLRFPRFFMHSDKECHMLGRAVLIVLSLRAKISQLMSMGFIMQIIFWAEILSRPHYTF